MKKMLLSPLLIVILLMYSNLVPCNAENTNSITWMIDTVITIKLADSINEMTENTPDPAQHICVWIMGWMDIPDRQYYQFAGLRKKTLIAVSVTLCQSNVFS